MTSEAKRRPVLLVVHSPESRPGQVEEAINAKGWPTERCCPKAGDTLPEALDGHAGVVVFGGPMSANDDHLDFIRAELDWIPRVLDSGTPYFGICLGAQMLARCLGARVARHPDGLYEVGYYPIEPTPAAGELFDGSLYVYHWHGEGFEVPNCADLLVKGEIFPNQAFRCDGSAYGIQFHPEIQQDILKLWAKEAWDLTERPGGHAPMVQLEQHARYGAVMHRWLDGFIDAWLADEIAA